MRVYRFIDYQRAEFDLKTLCRVCEVSRSAFYDWARAEAAGPSDAVWEEAVLANRIYDIWARSRRAYGAPRVTAALWREGTQVNPKRVERLMAKIGIQGASGRRKVRTTRRDPEATPAPDLVNRDFEPAELDELWVGDVTYIATKEGWLFLATVLDACSRCLLGWSMADHLRTELCTNALRQAVATRGRAPLKGVVFHSDHGCQYTSADYKKLCDILGITQSMGTVGDCLLTG